VTWAISADPWSRCRVAVALLAQTWLKPRARWRAREDAGAQLSDDELVDRARRDEPGAVEQIYQRHAAAVYRRLTHLVGADPEREDLMQEVFSDLFRQLRSFRGAASLQTYLFRIVSNKACDHLRERQRRRRAVVDLPGLLALERDPARMPRSNAPSPEDRVGHAQELALIERALDQLTPKKRIAFVLRVADNLSLKEIAEQMGATVFTVAQRLRHADRELRRLLAKARRSPS
jgi:RNA polymerase sigma-70 factor (ECF subfamily)